MIQPSDEQRALLTGFERFAYTFADFCNRRLKRVLKVWNRFFTISFVNLSTGRRIRIEGLENLKGFTSQDRVILVANHRSFFDFYIISWVTYRLTNMGQRSIFPVRSTFFYENLLGVFVNLVVAGMGMFPPVMRRKHQKAFNQYAMDRATAELSVPGTVLGMHPEGTRNKEDDPYTFLKARPGVGELALRSDNDVKVIPIFIYGLSNRILTEMKMNFFAVKGNEIDVVIGNPVDLSHLQDQPLERETYVKAAEVCLDAVRQLGQKQKQIARDRLESQSHQTT